MGNNVAYTAFQYTIISIYDKGVLDLELLDTLAALYADTDIDSGGDTGLLAQDGSDLETICIRTVDPSFPLEQQPGEEQDDYWDRKYDKWLEIEGRWGW